MANLPLEVSEESPLFALRSARSFPGMVVDLTFRSSTNVCKPQIVIEIQKKNCKFNIGRGEGKTEE